ncbi:MAG: nucleotidyltransferase domain-containing protein [Mesorhizobium sp.]|nr:MAG: nucleotidyltransferase domain-containing protein [Mesorhizobium sp.]
MSFDLPSSVVNISIFGSWVRRDNDEHSDLDVLVTVMDGSGKTPDQEIADFVRPLIGGEPSISWYGVNKLRSMFEQGDLFAWHLFLESKSVGPYPELQAIFGRPASYATAQTDIMELHGILREVSVELIKAPRNAVFEMGILYVCARNIAMSASDKLCPTPQFGRYSPFALPIEFPLTADEYDLAMSSRMAGQRGRSPPLIRVGDVEDMQERLMSWSELVLAEVSRVVAP